MIDPHGVMRYVVLKVPPFVGPNVMSNAPSDWLPIRYCHLIVLPALPAHSWVN